jgi:hypothetical protein
MIHLTRYMSLIAAQAALVPTLALGQTQEATQCEHINDPATQSFDFTEDLTRWGSPGAYNIDNIPHHVRSISVNNLPIFDETDPDENNRLYRWVNRVHVDTRDKVIANELLFNEDSVVNSQVLAESERLLRERKFAGDARIRVINDCTSDVDLEVVTKEVWSLTPELKFKNVGGHTSTGIGIRDSNFLGTGQHLAFNFRNDQERSSAAVEYRNQNIMGSRMQVQTELATNSDGHHYVLSTGLPFYALNNEYAWNVTVDSIKENLNQYSLANRVASLKHTGKSAEASYGFSSGLQDDHASRISLGLRTEQHILQSIPGQPNSADNYRPTLDLSYPFLEYEYLEDKYTQGYNIYQIDRTEDLMVGRHLRTRFGYAPGTDSSYIFTGNYGDTLLYHPKMLLQLNASWDARYDRNLQGWQDTMMTASLDFHREQTSHRSLYLGLEAQKALNLNNGRQLELGGTTGLRGYDNHFLQGDGSIRFTAEQRLFTDYYPLHLLRVGFAAYVDAGKIYGNTLTGTDILFSNVGLGLRLSPSKSESGQVVHMDLAWPLRTLPGQSSSPLLVVQMKKSF